MLALEKLHSLYYAGKFFNKPINKKSDKLRVLQKIQKNKPVLKWKSALVTQRFVHCLPIFYHLEAKKIPKNPN